MASDPPNAGERPVPSDSALERLLRALVADGRKSLAQELAGELRARPPSDPLLTVRQLAEREGMPEQRVRWLIATHGLPVHRRGGIRIRWSAYCGWLERGRRK